MTDYRILDLILASELRLPIDGLQAIPKQARTDMKAESRLCVCFLFLLLRFTPNIPPAPVSSCCETPITVRELGAQLLLSPIPRL